MAVKLSSIDIVASVMISVSRTFSSMLSLELEEIPNVAKQEFTTAVFVLEGSYVSFVALTQDYHSKKVKGGILVYISRNNLSTLFGSLGINDLSSMAEINDACGEFCNVVAGGFKTNLVHMGCEDVQLTIPEHGTDSVANWFRDAKQGQKYRISFSYKGRGIMLADVFMSESS